MTNKNTFFNYLYWRFSFNGVCWDHHRQGLAYIRMLKGQYLTGLPAAKPGKRVRNGIGYCKYRRDASIDSAKSGRYFF